MTRLQSYLSGTWHDGQGDGSALVNPTTGEVLAHASTAGLDLGAALAHGRDVGGPALRAMTFSERAAALAGMSKAIHAEREALIELGIANAGNTRGDAKFDIDGATATLMAYARFARGLPDVPFLADGGTLQLTDSKRFVGQHVWVARHGVSVHVNAFNFPAWGMLEKAACSLLAGMPVLEKPGTPTAMMAERIAHIVVDSGLLPEGAFQFLCGGAGDLLDHVQSQDCVAFTGSSGTGRFFRAHAAFVERGARLNVEADSLNAIVLGPDVEDDAAVFDGFLREVAREVTQKAGQKCTCVRRLLVPRDDVESVAEALVEALGAVKYGDPTVAENRMGPLTNEDQFRSVSEGITRLATAGRIACGGPERAADQGAFIAPTLVVAEDGDADVIHADEVFGPVVTIVPYDGSVAEAARLVRRGDGMLMCAIYSDDRTWAPELAMALAPWTGRVYMVNSKVADQSTGPGLVLPNLVHGGPGRAGGGEELGGLRGLQFSMQRTAIQGFKPLLEANFPSGDAD